MNSKFTEKKEEILLKSIKGGKGVKKMSLSEITNFLKHNKVYLNILDSHGYNMLHYAIKSENGDVVQLLLSLDEEEFLTEKANPNEFVRDENKNIILSPILFALQICNDYSICSRIIKLLIKHGADISTKDEEGCSLFLRASEKGKIDLLDYLINLENSQFDINETCPSGSALHMAIIGEQEEVISYLLDHKIDLNLTDSNRNNALHYALQLKMNNVFKVIQDFVIANSSLTDKFKKSLFNAQNEYGNTILHELAYAKCHFMIEMIRKFPDTYAVDPEIKNKDGNTYKGVQDNIVKLQKDKEERDKQMKDIIRKEKERIAEEKRQEIIREKEMIEIMKLAEEKREQIGQTFVKYRAWLFVLFCIIFMAILFLVVSNVAKKKEKIIY